MTNETKHTPGPWTISPNGVNVLNDGGTKRICECDWYQMGLLPCAANARLIAAAPELLAALEACADHLENKVDATRLTMFDVNLRCQPTQAAVAIRVSLLKYARAAIAKTKGGQNE